MKNARIFLLGVCFDLVGIRQSVELALSWALGDRRRYIVTPNPEFVVEAQKDHDFQKILSRADLSLADGRGIQWAANYLGLQIPERITGVDFMIALCEALSQKQIPVFFLGAGEGIAAKAARKLQDRFPKLKVAGTFSGSSSSQGDIETVAMINATDAKVLFVAYGAPRQEKWIDRNAPKLDNVRLLVGVGGAFDYISGHVVRAPLIIRQIGLEWLWRLIHEPKRLPRIFRAVIVFPFIVIRLRRV